MVKMLRHSTKKLNVKQGRKLALGDLCEDDRHCSGPDEHNVFSKPNENATEFYETDDEGDAAPEEESPGLAACEVDEEGNFGTGGQRQVVDFEYQIQTTIDQSVNTMENNILPDLEVELSRLLLTDLLSGTLCAESPFSEASTEGVRRLSLEQPEDTAPVTGIFADPVDEILPGVDGVRCQTPLANGARRCFIVSGSFTLASDNETLPVDWAIPQARDSIKQIMEDGLLDSIHSDVVSVGYLEAVEEGPDPVEEVNNTRVDPTQTVSEVATSDDVRAWPWVLLSVGGLAVVAGLFVARRNRNSDDRNTSYAG